MNLVWRAMRLTVAAVVVAGLVACTEEGKGGDGAGQKLSSGSKMTFDLYLGERLDFLDYAVRELKADCMAKAGYPQMKDAGNEVYKGASQLLLIERQRFRGFASEADARAQGFGANQAAERRPLVSYDPSYDKRSDQCTKEANAALDADAQATVSAYADLGNAISSEFAAWSRQKIRAGLPPLIGCLATAGFTLTDQDAFVNKMWDVKLFNIPLGKLAGEPYAWEPTKKPGTVQVGPPVPARAYEPSPQESELAAAWYRCDEQTGRIGQLMKEVEAVQAEIIAKYEDKLAELNPKIETLAKKAAELVGEQ